MPRKALLPPHKEKEGQDTNLSEDVCSALQHTVICSHPPFTCEPIGREDHAWLSQCNTWGHPLCRHNLVFKS